MIIAKYTKTDRIRFVSHIDTLRVITRTIDRAGVLVAYSEGFNPHKLVNFGPALALGIGSLAEYFCVKTEMNKQDFEDVFNDKCVDGIKLVKYFQLTKDPNLNNIIKRAKYILPIRLNSSQKKQLINEVRKEDLNLVLYRKGKIKEVAIADKIYSFEIFEEYIEMVLATGNNNLRADRFIEKLTELTGIELIITDIVKTNQYIDLDGEIVDMDDYLRTLEYSSETEEIK